MSLLLSTLALLACSSTPPATEAPAPAPAKEHAEAPTPAAAPDAAHGKEILAQKCTSCHGDEVYTRADHKVKDAKALEAQVDMCGGAAHLDDAAKADVTAYLSSEAYKF